MTLLTLLGNAACEALFYALTAGWYLLCVQWDVVDVLLGGPDLNRRHAGSQQEREVEAAGIEAALSWSKSKTEPPGAPGQSGVAPGTEAAAARSAAQVDGRDVHPQADDLTADSSPAPAGAPPLDPLDDSGGVARGSPETEACSSLEAAPPLELRHRRSSALSRFGSRASSTTEADGDGRSLYGKLKRKLPAKERLNVKARFERRVAEYSSQLIPDFAAAVGVEAAAGTLAAVLPAACGSSHQAFTFILDRTLAAALPGGVRDAGVRMVDRAEAAVRRWALFAGGAGLLFRLLLWR